MNGIRTLPVMSALLAIFLTPLLLAWASYHTAVPIHHVGLQHGELLLPLQRFEPPPLAENDGRRVDAHLFVGHWTLLVRSNGRCADECLQLLATLRNVRLAQGRAMTRVQRVLVVPARTDFPLQASGERDLRMAVAARWPLPSGSVYLLDPQGHLVLRYPPGFAPRGLLADLQRLLRLSGES